MLVASQALVSVAVLSVGVIYGTDIFSALVLRPAMAALTDRELTQAAGRIHEYGDQRLPLPGAAGIIAAAAAGHLRRVRRARGRGRSRRRGVRRAARMAWAIPTNRRSYQPPHDQSRTRSRHPRRCPCNAETMGLNHHNTRGAARQRNGTAHRHSHQLIKPLPRCRRARRPREPGHDHSGRGRPLGSAANCTAPPNRPAESKQHGSASVSYRIGDFTARPAFVRSRGSRA